MAKEDIEKADDSLNGLPEKERRETEEILAEIGEGTKPEDKKPDEKPAEDPKKPDAKAPEKPEDKKPDEENVRRDPKMMPAWQHKVAVDKLTRERDEALAAVEAAKGKPADPAKPEPSKTTPEGEEDELKKFADAKGIEVSDLEELAKILEKKVSKSDTVSPELQKKIEEFDAWKAEEAAGKEEILFGQDFDKQILPLVKAEYGDDVPADTISKIKETLRTLAYSPENVKTPYANIYRGWSEFREVIPPARKSAEGGRDTTVLDSGKGSFGGKDVSEITDDDIAKMSDEEFDNYSKALAKQEKDNKKK